MHQHAIAAASVLPPLLLPLLCDHLTSIDPPPQPRSVEDIGLKWYIIYFVLYMTSVEFFVYWQHRILHMGVGYRCGLS